ncbi:MAG: IMP dehydrogenase [bacterium]
MIKDIKFDFNDISLIPTLMSEIGSRSEINIHDEHGKLPLFVSPMDTVIDEKNHNLFYDLGFNVCIPRQTRLTKSEQIPEYFISYGLDEIEMRIKNKKDLPPRILIDVANGHSKRVVEVSREIKRDYDVELMVGNIANPKTYSLYANIGVDYVRCGIGAGHACTTSANSSIHYPMASLIKECAELKELYDHKTKIVADGGFKNYDDIIKALGLGADYVMLGNIINKSVESCGKNYIYKDDKYLQIEDKDALDFFKDGVDIYKMFRGMSTKEVQKKWGKKELRTSEGIVKINKVEYNIGGWVNNFQDYLKSCMSYQGKSKLNNFIGLADFVFVSQNAYLRFNK